MGWDMLGEQAGKGKGGKGSRPQGEILATAMGTRKVLSKTHNKKRFCTKSPPYPLETLSRWFCTIPCPEGLERNLYMVQKNAAVVIPFSYLAENHLFEQCTGRSLQRLPQTPYLHLRVYF